MPGQAEPSPTSTSPRRGRPPSRSRREIAEAAIVIADGEGLDAVTMRSVGRSLGTGAASLYRYVKTRDELVALMVDEVNGEFSLEGAGRSAWEDRMLGLAHQARGIYRRHPWLIEALNSSPPLGPNGCAYLDHSLGVLAVTGADGRTMLEAIGVFNGLVRLLCGQESGHRAGAGDSGGAAAIGDHLGDLGSTGPYPNLVAALTDSDPASGDDQFDRILRRVLSGLLAGGA